MCAKEVRKRKLFTVARPHWGGVSLWVTELSKYLLHKRELDTKKLKSEQRRYLCTGLVESMGHRALSGETQGNKLLITQVAYSSCTKQRLGLQRKTILDIQNSKDISACACGYCFLIQLRSLQQTLQSNG
jgi:hypothetical protein